MSTHHDSNHFKSTHHASTHWGAALAIVVELVAKICRRAAFQLQHSAAAQFMSLRQAAAEWRLVLDGSRAGYGVQKSSTVEFKQVISKSAAFQTKRSERATIPRCD